MEATSNLKVWEIDSGPRLSRSKPGKNGRPRDRAQATPPAAKAVSVQILTAKCLAAEVRDMAIRDTTKGTVHAPLWVRTD